MPTFRVVVDYGHGGSKPGAVYSGVEEKTVNLLTGKAIYRELHEQENGRSVQVMLTRDTDYDIPLSTRCSLINEHHRHAPVHLCLSVHYNAAGSSSAAGFEVYHAASSAKGTSAASSVTASIQRAGVPVRGHGSKTTDQLGRRLAMIHKPVPPAILIEVGFLTNPVDRGNAVDPEFRRTVARATARGIWEYLEKEAAS